MTIFNSVFKSFYDRHNVYQEVEYIESTGTQYINTWWYPSSNYCKVVADMDFQGWVDTKTAVFFWMVASQKAYSLHKNPEWQINAWSTWNISIANYSNWRMNVDYTADNGSYSVTLWQDTYTGSYSNTVAQSSYPMNIFTLNELGSPTWWAYAKLYSFKIYSDASTLERDFVPCYRKSDSVIWLYDVVNDIFYTNAGSWTFTKWSDV